MQKVKKLMVFGRKKIEKPKSQLGLALFNYDNIYNRWLKGIIGSISSGKSLNKKRTDKVLAGAFTEMDKILNDISKTNFKTDYRSDKIRDILVHIIDVLKDNLETAKSFDYDFSRIEKTPVLIEIENIPQMRSDIKKRMKDLESDYL